jgi:ferric-dicitrate binding protein FerR (iron transport regulator)
MDLIQTIEKFRNNEKLSREEMEFLMAWLLLEDGENQFLEEIVNQWNVFETAQVFDSHQLWQKTRSRINSTHTRTTRVMLPKAVRYTLEIAATIILALGLAIFMKNKAYIPPADDHKIRREQVEIYNPKGIRTTITLPDSSRVTLNSDSKIFYNRPFTDDTRMVTLEGEAFFEITKIASQHPFVVYVNTTKITALGTSFNVRSYTGEKYVETTLIEGSLKVDTGEKEKLLLPGRQISIDKSSHESNVSIVNTQNVIAWIEGKLYFHSLSFQEIAAILERTFKVNINVASNTLGQKKFTGKFENGENLEQIFRVMKLSVPFTAFYDKRANTILIY